MQKTEFIRLMQSARNAIIKAEKIERKLFDAIEEEFENIDFGKVETDAENADNIFDAITCFITYGEYSPEQIWNEMQKARKKK